MASYDFKVGKKSYSLPLMEDLTAAEALELSEALAMGDDSIDKPLALQRFRANLLRKYCGDDMFDGLKVSEANEIFNGWIKSLEEAAGASMGE